MNTSINNTVMPRTAFENRTSEVQETAQTSGAGMHARTRHALPEAGDRRQENSGALKSLSSFMSGKSAVDVEVLLVQVAVAMRDTEATSQKERINTDQATKRAQMTEREAKLEESAKKLEKAQNGSIWDKIKLAFEWLGAIIAAAVAAVMIATGVGAVVGGLLLAAAITAVVMAVDSTVQQATGLGIAGNIAKAAGASPAEIAKADMGFRIGTAILGVGFAIAGGGASAATAVKSAIQAGMNTARTAIDAGTSLGRSVKDVVQAAAAAFKAAASSATDALSQTAKMVRSATDIAQGAVGVGTAATTIGSSVQNHQNANLRADAQRLEAQAKVDEAMMQMLDDAIDQALQRLIAATDRFNQILDDITSAMSDRSNTMSRARFAG